MTVDEDISRLSYLVEIRQRDLEAATEDLIAAGQALSAAIRLKQAESPTVVVRRCPLCRLPKYP